MTNLDFDEKYQFFELFAGEGAVSRVWCLGGKYYRGTGGDLDTGAWSVIHCCWGLEPLLDVISLGLGISPWVHQCQTRPPKHPPNFPQPPLPPSVLHRFLLQRGGGRARPPPPWFGWGFGIDLRACFGMGAGVVGALGAGPSALSRGLGVT